MPRPITLLLLIFLTAAAVAAGPGAAFALTAREAVDGDTLVLENGDRVRLIGLDTPELEDKYGRNAKTAKYEGLKKTAVDLYALEAKSAAAEWVKGQKLRIQKDPANSERAHRDDYGRLLAYVCRESDNRCLAEDLIAGGYGLVYKRFKFNRRSTFLRLEEEARAEGRGLWKHREGKPSRSDASKSKAVRAKSKKIKTPAAQSSGSKPTRSQTTASAAKTSR